MKSNSLRAATVLRTCYLGSSPISRTKISATPYGVADIFMLEMGLERPLRKHAGGMFLGRGRVPQISDASGTDVDEI